MIQKWKLRRPPSRSIAIQASRTPRPVFPQAIFPPSSTIMQEPVSGNYLYRRAVQECDVWLMASCCTIRRSILNSHSLDPADVEQYGAFAGELIDYYASKMNSEQLFHTNYLYVPSHIVRTISADIKSRRGGGISNPFYLPFFITCYLSVLRGLMLENHELIHKCMASLPEIIARQQQYGVLNQPLLECFAKIDLLYVLRYQTPPTLGSTFEQSMQPLRPDVVQAVQDTRPDPLGTLTGASGIVSSIEDDDS